MKTGLKRILRDEKGQAMVLALIMLVIGGLVSTPLLAYMGTGLVAGEVYEVKTAELYAADAGVEDAVWNIQLKTNRVQGLTQCNQSTNYTITGVNGKTVDVTITLMTLLEDLPCDYRIVSRAIGDGSETEIEAYVAGESKYGDYVGILHNVITSQEEITLQPGANVTPSEGEHSPIEYYGDAWPPFGELEDFYWQQVEDETPYPFGTIDLDGVDMDLELLYRDGELDIKNSNNTPATLTLTGTIYITGDTLIKPNKDMTLDLNGQTIFVASNTTGQPALWIGGQCTIEGPGAIIVVGDIYFEPNIEAGMTEPIFIHSISGETLLQPGGDFYGSIAGSVEVQLQPGTSLSYPEEEGWYGDINFPIGVQQLVYSIYSWEVIQQ
jgi:hypothetical protein